MTSLRRSNMATDSGECPVIDKSCNTDDLRYVCTEGMYGHVKEVSQLVTKARLQAREADIRARYAAQFAERAVAEAQSAHQVCASLAKTSRVVASLALEFANNTDSFLESSTENIDCSNISNFDESSFRSDVSNSDTSSEMAAPAPDYVSRYTSTSPEGPTKLSSEERYQATYPDDLPTEEGAFEIKLSTVWEDGNLLESPSNDITEEQRALAEKRKKLEIKKTLQLYKDSKIAQTAILKKSMETGDARELYNSKGVQTITVGLEQSSVQSDKICL